MSFYHVKIYYGPCESFHTVSYKPQKLRGLKDQLQKMGYRVDLAPVDYENYCVLVMCAHEIFRCNIKNLRFNTPYEYDPVVQRAVKAVEDVTRKFKRARSYLWIMNLLEQNMFRSELGPKEYWPQDYDELQPFASLEQCATRCCNILYTSKDTETNNYLLNN